MDGKLCSKCGRMLPAAMFNKANWLKSGLRSDCKDCYRQFKKDWWALQPKGAAAKRNKDLAALVRIGLRLCVVCGETLPFTEDNFARFASGRYETTCRACVREKVRRWAQANQERYKVTAYANCARRYASKRNRMPKWISAAHKSEIKQIYARAKELSKSLGTKMHVDHIVPLVGKRVSGLHVPWNMQIITASANAKKFNKWS